MEKRQDFDLVKREEKNNLIGKRVNSLYLNKKFEIEKKERLLLKKANMIKI